MLSARVILTDEGYPEPEQVGAFFHELERRLGGRPGVASAGATMVLPLGDTDIDLNFVLEGTSPSRGVSPSPSSPVSRPVTSRRSARRS